MSVKAVKYIFRRIRGRIVPIRRGVDLASEAINKIANEVISTPVSKKTLEPSKKFLVGRGADFNVWGKNSDIVMKIPRNKVGTANASFTKRYPETADKVALSKAVQENLPNYGIPTIETDVVRFRGAKTAIIQPKATAYNSIPFGEARQKAFRNNDYTMRELKRMEQETGINFDGHSGNFDSKGNMIDTGINLKKSKISLVKNSQMAEDILGTKEASYYSTKISDVRPMAITDVAAEYGASRKAKKFMRGKLFEEFHGGEYLPAYTIKGRKK